MNFKKLHEQNFVYERERREREKKYKLEINELKGNN